MLTRCSTARLLAVLIFAAGGAAVCPSASAVVFSGAFDLSIPSPDDPNSEYGLGKMADAVIDVPEHISIGDLDVAVTLDHESFFDLQIVLVSPSGVTVTLCPPANEAFMIRDVNGRYVSAGGENRFFFDDEAAVCIEDATPPFDQPFKPAAGFALGAYDGEDAFGQWRLCIEDFFQADTGRLESVELVVTPEPSTGVLVAAAGVFVRSGRYRRRVMTGRG